MLPSAEQLVEQIHDSPTRIVLAATGGGSRAIAELLDVPGGSRTLLEAVVPYSAPAMVDWLGGLPDEFCSAATARAMAVVAFQRARRYVGGKGDSPIFVGTKIGTVPEAGVACTASLATDRPKRGQHRLHVALQTASMTATWHLPLQKDRRTRAEEERLTGHLLLNVIAEACGVAERLPLELLEGEHVETACTHAPAAWQDLFLGKVGSVQVCPLPKGEGTLPKAVFPGAFNPLHAGHRRMAEVAQKILGGPVAFEISIENVDKPPLSYAEMEHRLGQFPPDACVYFTRAATFEEKSRLFPGATFLVGVDTLARIAAPQYYGDNVSACECALQRVAGHGTVFLVFGRDLGEGFVRLDDLNLPSALRILCREVPPELFREDVSSTSLRKSASR